MKIIIALSILLLLLVSGCQQSEQEQTADVAVHTAPTIDVYRSPTCNCCHNWIKHLEENNFTVIDKLTQDMASIKEAVQLPKKMASCHTAIIDGYIIEGHVPAADIMRLLAEKPDIAGLSVPKMPIGTPGMEIGQRKDPFIVFQFDKAGQYSAFSQYQPDENNQYQTE